jgi:hypothetical protein
MYPLIAATAPPIGLGFSSHQIARSLLVLGPVVLLIQLICYPWLAKRLSYVSLWRLSALMFLAAYVGLPLLPLLKAGTALQWVCLCTTLGCRVAAVVIGYTSIAILVCPFRNTFLSELILHLVDRDVASQQKGCDRRLCANSYICCAGDRTNYRRRTVVLGPCKRTGGALQPGLSGKIDLTIN